MYNFTFHPPHLLHKKENIQLQRTLPWAIPPLAFTDAKYCIASSRAFSASATARETCLSASSACKIRKLYQNTIAFCLFLFGMLPGNFSIRCSLCSLLCSLICFFCGFCSGFCSFCSFGGSSSRISSSFFSLVELLYYTKKINLFHCGSLVYFSTT